MSKLGSVAAALLIVAGACAGGPRFAEEDLPSIVLQSSEAPFDTQWIQSESGAFTLEQLSSDPDQMAALEADGFLAAFDSIFASPGLAGVEGEISRRGARLVDSSVFLFDSLDGAEASFKRLEGDVPASFGDTGTIFPIGVSDLGDEAFGVRVEFFNTSLGPDVGVMFNWRVENLILRVVVWAEALEDDEVRALADVIHAHVVM